MRGRPAMTDFLLEFLSEEIPARMQRQACDDLARLFAAELGKAGLVAGSVETYATPRRLALIARGLPETAPAVSIETKGPRADAPPQALAGFLGKTGLTREQLVERSDAKGNVVLFAVIEQPGRAAVSVLSEAVPAVIGAFPWPKSMRWGAASTSMAALRWVRPLRGIVALFGEEVVPFAVAGIASGAGTVGHRFRHPGLITIGSADDYADKLRMCHVLLDPREREAIIRERAAAAAAAAGLTIVPDEGLVAENAGLTEWPVPLLGRFDPAFLSVPREVIQLTMRTNQKYFACVDAAGALAPAFVSTANIDAADGGAAIVRGNEKVLAARLADAKFFWEGDRKVPLAEQAGKLDQIVFHEKLGTVADKVARVAKLARWLAEEGIVPGADPELTEQVARLCKADLVTGMVGEFPELQGIMGGYYARAEGLDDQVADAIRDHYKPVGQGDTVPTAPVTVAVSLADKLDTVAAFWVSGIYPTGSRDPFALRRSALAVLDILVHGRLRAHISKLFIMSLESVGRIAADEEFRRENLAQVIIDAGERLKALADAENRLFYEGEVDAAMALAIEQEVAHRTAVKIETSLQLLLPFLADRLKVQQREAGVRHDLIDAVFALGGEDDLVRLLARVHALQAFVATEDGANLLAGYKRAANILRIEEKRDGTAFGPTTALDHDASPEESGLVAALDVAEPAAAAAVAAEDFAGAMRALSVLRGPIDAFFERVTVNDADPAIRRARLGLLVRIRDAVHRVADFSRIEG